MKAAFLFVEKHPNFDQAFHAIDRLSTPEVDVMDSYVCTGLWGLCEALRQRTKERLEAVMMALLRGHEGSAVELAADDAPSKLVSEQVFVVQFNSIHRPLAFALHQKLRSRADYLGLIEVHPNSPLHRVVFSGLGPLLKIEQRRIFIRYSDPDEGEEHATELLNWLRSHYIRLSLIAETYNSDARFTVFDVRTGPAKEFDVQATTRHLNNEWEIACEHVLYKLLDVAPDAADEMESASERLRQPNLSSADCAQVAVNFRRCLEKIADILIPAESNNQRDKYKLRLSKYVQERLASVPHYSEYVEAELTEVTTRIEKLYNMGNKGVHEDWFRQAFVTVALRLVVLIHDLLLPVAPAKAIALLEHDLFEKVIRRSPPKKSS